MTADADTVTDVDLWQRLRGGDREALGELFDRHGNAVYNFAFRRTASWSLAEEVVQATFLTTWRRAVDHRLAPLDHTTALPWLLGVASHEGQNAARSLHRAERRDLRAEAPTSLGDPADDVAARIDDERRMAAVRRAMGQIPAHQRVVIELVLWSGLSLVEAADVLHVAEGTVKSRLSRGRTQLARVLQPTSINIEDDA